MMNLDYILLGSKIRTLRKERGLTQEELAELCEISPSFMGHIERGTRKMSLETLDKICRVLKCSSDELLGLGFIPREDISCMIDHLIAELQRRKA